MNKHFSLKKVSQMNPSVARLAEMHAKETLAETLVHDRCMMLFVQSAADHVRFLLSHVVIAQFIAATVLKDK